MAMRKATSRSKKQAPLPLRKDFAVKQQHLSLEGLAAKKDQR